MDPSNAVDLVRQSLWEALTIGSPILVVGLVVAIVMGLLQTLTQVQDQTISFVPKIVAMAIALAFCLPWLIGRMVEFSQDLITNIPQTLTGG